MVAQIHRRLDASGRLRRRPQQAVVGADQQRSRCAAQRNRTALVPTPGSTTARCTPAGRKGIAFSRTKRRAGTSWAAAVRDVDHGRAGGDALDHAVTDADPLVALAVVGQERDRQHGYSRRCGRWSVAQQRVHQAVDVVPLGLDVHSGRARVRSGW